MNRFIAGLFTLAVFVGGGCSKDSDDGVLSDSEIVTTMAGPWVKTFEIKRFLSEGKLWSTVVEGFESITIEAEFTSDGVFRLWDDKTQEWMRDKHFIIQNGQMLVDGKDYGRVAFSADGRVMVWTVEKQDNTYHEITERFETHWERKSWKTPL